MCFLGVFHVFFGVWKREKCVRKSSREQKLEKKNVFLTCVRVLDEKRPSKKRFGYLLGYLLGHISFWVNGMGSPLFFFIQKNKKKY